MTDREPLATATPDHPRSAALDEVLTTAVAGGPVDAATVDRHAPLPNAFGVVVDASGIRYLGAAGARVAGADQAPAGTDTVLALYSVTKAVTATLALRLHELGMLDLDAPAGDLVPELDSRSVLVDTGAGPPGQTRPASTRVTSRMLLTHTAGFSYDFLHPTLHQLVRDREVPHVGTGRRAALELPLVAEPGTGWNYGIAMDWLGLVIEAATGQRLGEAMRAHVLDPLGMHDTSFEVRAEQQARRAALHLRGSDGAPQPRGLPPVGRPELDMGGHGLSSTIADVGRFLSCWVAGGRIVSDDRAGERLLTPATVAEAFRDQLPATSPVRALPAVDRSVAHDLDLLPGVPVGWGLSWLLNQAPLPTGRAAGSASWAGLANLWFWVDRAQGLGGMFATQLLPFGDPAARHAAEVFEATAYRTYRPLAVGG